MTDEELIARLRVTAEWLIGKEAADRIEALVKANAMLEGLAGLASIGVDGHGAVVELAKRMTKRALDAEARAERLEVALREAAEDIGDFGDALTYVEGERDLHSRAYDIMRSIHAALEGGAA